MTRRRWVKIPADVRSDVIGRAARGECQRKICNDLGLSGGVVSRVVKPFGGVFRSSDVWGPAPGQLSAEDRIEIKLGIDSGRSLNQIAKELGYAGSTVSREVKKNGGREKYRPAKAHRAAYDNRARPKPSKLESNPVLCALVEDCLKKFWSPQQIADWLRLTFPNQPEMWVSHETIYTTLYLQGRGELRRELAACLRTGRAKRKQQGRTDNRGKIPGMVMISDRPAEVEDRAVPGHWEGDLIIGKNSASAAGTLVERASRYVILLHLPNGHGAEQVRLAMIAAMKNLPEALVKTMTWDQGREMAQHAQFTIDTGIQVYFCDPHSPWQRGSNENTNGLLRQYMPKGTDLNQHSHEDLERIAMSLNTRPRKTLGGMTPLEKLTEIIASAA